MMRLPPFRYRAPRTVQDAALWLAESPADTMLVAGGTDLLPNMKRRQQTPRTLIALRGIHELRTMASGGGNGVSGGTSQSGDSPRLRSGLVGIRIGAGVTLSILVRDERIRTSMPGLWQAAVQVATPHLRNMGTIGGNLCLDTRCTYYDQSHEWRKAIDFCMKKRRTPGRSSPRCLAVSSTTRAGAAGPGASAPRVHRRRAR
jgi:4-hydroxybenzoyl-CoA reductase subunit beta